MKVKNALFLTMLSSLLLFSCNNDDNEVKGNFDGKPVKFSTQIANQTRVVGSTWEEGDAIGIYMTATGTPLSPTCLAINKKHATTGNGEFAFSTPSDAVYFPSDGSSVDFVAYYPHQTTITDLKYSVNVGGNQSGKLAALDLMYSNDLVNKNKTSQDAVLGFSHQLTLLSLKLDNKSGASLDGMTVTLTGLKTKADFSLIDGSLVVDASSTGNIIAHTDVTKNLSEAVLIPETAINGAKMEFNIPGLGKTFTWDIPANQNFDAKTKYTYDVEIKSEGLLVASSNITNWTDKPGGTIVIGDDGEEQVGDGTQSNPYTINQLSAKVGETGKWIKGYIVGSTAKTRAVGTPSKENILIALTAGETNEDNCIPVDISDSPVKENLDIVTYGSLIGKEIKVQGDIVNDKFGGILSVINVIAQEGGATPTPPGPGGDPEEIFNENFGTTDSKDTKAKINVYTEYAMGAPITYSDPYGTWADLRTTSGFLPTYNMHLWLPAYGTDKESGLLIEGIESGYKKMSLSYEIATNTKNTDANAIIVKCNGVAITIPSLVFENYNSFEKITVDIPDNTTSIEFYSGPANTAGYRIDNIIIKAAK